MTLHLSYTHPNGNRKTIWLQKYQVVTVGRGMESDEVCEFDDTMAQVHFQIANTDLNWVVRSMASFPVQLFVNDQALTAWEQTLEDGDCIQAGRTRFEIAIEGCNQTSLVEAEVPVEEVQPTYWAESTADHRLRWSKHPNTSLGISVEWETSRLPEIPKLLRRSGRIFAAVNLKRLGRAVDGLSVASEDLFQMAPEEIRATDSLHLIELQDGDLERLVTPLLEASRCDGACLISADLPREQLIREMRFTWAWFIRPRNLPFHLSHGSSQLAKMLLQPLGWIVIADAANVDAVTIMAESEKLAQCQNQLRMFQENEERKDD